MTYKPCTAAQFRIMEYLREVFDTSLCLIYPSRPKTHWFWKTNLESVWNSSRVMARFWKVR